MKEELEKKGYELLNKGWRGEIRTKETPNGKVARKVPISADKKGALIRESFLLGKMQGKLSFIPELVETGDGRFEYKFIEGITLKDHKILNKDIFIQLVNIAFELDKLGIVHGEIDKPTGNVIINKEGKIFLIDFERGKLLLEPDSRNLRMLGQFMSYNNIFHIKDFVEFQRTGANMDDIKNFLIEKINKHF